MVDEKISKNAKEQNVDYDDDDHVSDYYDANGKIATLRKKRSTRIDNFKKQRNNQKKISKRVRRSNRKTDLDPLGRSYYFSTYRRKGFSPDHWRQQLSK